MAEALETRLLLTTLVLEAGATDDTVFVYADAEESEPGGEVSAFNELRISTLSGVGPIKDVVIEILNRNGDDIPGNVNGVPFRGGPGGVNIFEEIGFAADDIRALATNDEGETYGIDEDGFLFEINPNSGAATNLGQVIDTDNPFSGPEDVFFEDFAGASFDPVSGLLYAVATGPTGFDALGVPTGEGQVLITVSTINAEAEAVGHNIGGQADYSLSQLFVDEITTIVYSQQAGDNTEGFGLSGDPINNDGTRPVFIAYNDVAGDEGEDNPNQFVTISVNPAASGLEVDVVTELLAFAPADSRVEGLMYAPLNNGPIRLFGLNGADANVLVEVDLFAADPDEALIDVVEYPNQPFSDAVVDFGGMSYDVVNNVGYATDADSGFLYSITTTFLIVDPEGEGELVVQGGLADIYFMYIASSTPDVMITLTAFTISDDGITYTPTGGEPAFLFVDEDDSDITTPDTAGGVMIGTRPFFRDDDLIWRPTTFLDSSEISTNDPGPVGAYPGGFFRPGIVLAATGAGDPEGADLPQNIGRIQVGGGVFGDVIINGSIDTFYAGYLGTNVFDVLGDINMLAVGTQAGGITESDGSWTSVGGFFGLESPILNVNGEMGSFYSNDDWGLPVRVHGRSDAPEFPGLLDVNNSDEDTEVYIKGVRELERKVDEDDDDIFFAFGAFDYIFNNDSPYTAQYIGSVDGTVNIYGEEEDGVWDTEDYYSFSLMAGQTVSIDFFHPGFWTNIFTYHPDDPNSISRLDIDEGWIDLFDPRLNWVGNLGEVDQVTGERIPLTYTAEEAGIYTIAVNGVFGGTKWVGVPYRLVVSGLMPTSLGGGNALSDIRRDSFSFETDPVVQVVSGNMGALSVGGVFRSSNIIVNEGHLGALRTGANALPLTTDMTTRIWDAAVPVPDEIPVVGFGYEYDDGGALTFVVESQVHVSGDLGQISSPVRGAVHTYVGGNLQSLRFGGDLITTGLSGEDDDSGDETDLIVDMAGLIVVNGSIGEIYITGGYIGVLEDEFSGVLWVVEGGGIFANADGVGAPGVIDSITIGISLTTGEGIVNPVSVGASGGNVRFVDIAGPISHESGAFSGDFGPFSFDAGQSVVITDDSGSLARISPGFTGNDVEDFLFGADPPPGVIIPDGEGGVLSVKLLPVLDKTFEEFDGTIDRTEIGYAIVSIESTDGLVVSPVGGPVDIGVVQVQGNNNQAVVFRGSSAISVLRIEASTPVTIDAADDGGDGGGDDPADEQLDLGITRIVNSTPGGDIVAILIGQAGEDAGGGTASDDGVELVRVEGHLGMTWNSTGQIIQSILISPLTGTATDDPGGAQHNGLFSLAPVLRIDVTGALGDVDVAGDVGTIVINSDESRGVGQFDGVAGAILIDGNLNRIELGDGVRHPGTGLFAQSGVFVTGELATVVISGNGRDIGGPVYATGGINQVLVSKGARITGYNATAGAAERARGALSINATLAATDTFDIFQLETGGIVTSDVIGSISVTGEDSEIRGAMIIANAFNSIRVTNGAEGVFDSRFYATDNITPGNGLINQFTVGGQGIFDTVIVTHRMLNKLTVLSGGVIEDSEIRGELNLGSIIADEINRTDIDAINKLDKVTAREGIFDLVIEAGELGQVKASDDILGSAFFVAGPVKQIYTPGDFISTIAVTGPFGNLKALKAGGDIGTPTGGEIIVDGQVGSIVAGGDFLAEILLNWDPTPIGPGNPQGPHQRFEFDGVELKSLKAGGRIVGLGDIGGDVGKIQSGGELGFDGQTFSVHGDLKSLTVGSSKSPADLESNLVVDADLGNMKVYGSTNGTIDVFGDFNSLMLLGTAANRANVNEDITVGGDFNKLTIIEGDVLANLTIEGSGPKTNIKGSDIDGEILIGGGPGTEVVIEGSITGTYVVQGDADRIVLGGGIAAGAILVIDGDLAILEVAGDIEGLVHITGNVGLIRAANIIGTPDGVLDDLIVDGVVTVGGSIEQLDVEGVVENSYVLAGFDPGFLGSDDTVFAPTELRVDGLALDALEQALAGNIGKANIGVLDNSVVAAGVSPGNNRIFGDLDGSDNPGQGKSVIEKIVLGEVMGNDDADPYGVFADSGIERLQIEKTKYKNSTQILLSDGFRSWIVEEPAEGINGFVFFQGQSIEWNLGDNVNPILVTLTMSGPGLGEALPGDGMIESIELSGTTAKTKVQVVTKSGDPVDVGRLFSGDDEEIRQLLIDGIITEELSLGGAAQRLSLGGVGAGSVVRVGGDVDRADLGDLAGSDAAPTTVAFIGDVARMTMEQVSDNVSISAENIDRVQVQYDMAGMLSVTDQLLEQVKILGDLPGVISSNGDIEQISVKGMTGGEGVRDVQGIRAVGSIGQFVTGSMQRAVAAAGMNIEQALVRGDMAYSTLAAGLDIGPDGLLSNLDGDGINLDVPEQGDLVRVVIGGDFIESNLAAGVNAGDDGYFGTDDDKIQSRAIEDVDAPTVIDVSFPDLFTIDVTFSDPAQPIMSNIVDASIRGFVFESAGPQETFAIIAAGQIQSAFARGEVFETQGNILRVEVEQKGLAASSLIVDEIDNAAAAALAAIQVRADGLDNRFGTADDIVLFGDDNPLTDPTIFITFDESTNRASFHKTDGFAVETSGTNYFQITIDADQVLNRQGVNLDGEFAGQWPTGDGLPGGDFDYFFAVADLGDSVVTAFAPFAESFQANQRWNFQSQIGDNQDFSANPQLDQDFIRFNGLEEGQVLNVMLDDFGVSSESIIYEVTLWKIEEDASGNNFNIVVGELDGRDDLDPPRDLLMPELDELAFVIDGFVGYENLGQQFVAIDAIDFGITLLPNTLTDLNGQLAGLGNIIDINALTGHALDSIWAIADFQPNVGSPRSSLIRVDDLSEDVSNPDPDIGALVSIAGSDVGFEDIVGLEELNGVLYGIDAATNTLVTIDMDPNSPTYGVATEVGGQLGNLANGDLFITGLTVSPDGDGLMALHDQPVDVTDNFLVDALYTIDPATGEATFREAFNADGVRHGLAGQPGDLTLSGLPLYGSPLGDVVEITLNDGEEVEHVFGQGDLTDLGNGITVSSDVNSIDVNKRQQEFVDDGFYYAFEIGFVADSGEQVIDIADISWLNELQDGVIISVVTDEPDFLDIAVFGGVDADGIFNDLLITVDTEGADGDATIYFGATGEILVQEPQAGSLGGAVLGTDIRDDLNPQRDLIVADLEEFTVAPDILQDDMDALGYDVQQDLFTLIDSGTFNAETIIVTDPFNPNETVLLTGQVLSDIYTEFFDEDISLSDFRGIEFGRENEVWMIVQVTDASVSGPPLQRDSLLRVADILNPYTALTLSIHDLEDDGEQGARFTDIRELAYALIDPFLGQSLGTIGLSDNLYGIDVVTQTLVQIDSRPFVTDEFSNQVPNANFGTAVAVGGEVGNLGDPGTGGGNLFDITGLTFDSSGRLLGIENTANLFVRFSTDPEVLTESSRMQLLSQLPEGNFQALSFNAFSGESLIMKVVSSDPLGDSMTVSVGQAQASHTFGQADTTVPGVQSVTVSSSADNDPMEVNQAGGFYRFDVGYTQNVGMIELTIDDIEWLGDSSGDLDSIFVDDDINVQIVLQDKDSVTVQIDSDNGDGDFELFFGATSDLVSVSSSAVISFVDFATGIGSIENLIQIPEDGDYALQIAGANSFFTFFDFFDFGFFNLFGNFFSSGNAAASYDLSVEAFDDGNSDFGVSATTSGLLYDQIATTNAPIDLEPDSDDLEQDNDDPDLYFHNHPDWPFSVAGTLLEPGHAGAVVIDSELGNSGDLDIFTFRLEEGQQITVDVEADTLFGRDDIGITVGIYNGDLESISTVSNVGGEDVLTAPQQADPVYTAQAIFNMLNHDGVVIDPDVAGLGTYYVVVSIDLFETEVSLDEQIDYRLSITTTEPETVETPASQLVWLAFDGAEAEYLNTVDAFGPQEIQRPAFDAEVYDLGGYQNTIIQTVAQRIEQVYRDAGLGENEIEFTLTKPDSNEVFSTVIFGGRLPVSGLLGLAENVDRDNSDRSDSAVVMTDEMALFYRQIMEEDVDERLDQTINLLANVGAHELGHILGLEHAIEVDTLEPNNLMGYHDPLGDLELQEFEERNSFVLFGASLQPGFSNEIDMLLRNIGSGTILGE